MNTLLKVYLLLSMIALIYLFYRVEQLTPASVEIPMDLVVNSLKVVDRNSQQPVLILADSVPDAIIDGKTLPRDFKPRGMVYFDSFGNEVGGLVVLNEGGKEGLENTLLTFDYNNTDAFVINKQETPDAYLFGVTISDRNSPAEFEQRGTRGVTRIGYEVRGTDEKSQAGFVMNDNQGKQRIVLLVDENDEAKILLFDKEGKLIKDLAK